MRETQLRNKIKNILKEELNVKSKNRLNENNTAAEKTIKDLFKSGNALSISSIVADAIGGVVEELEINGASESDLYDVISGIEELRDDLNLSLDSTIDYINQIIEQGNDEF